MTTPLPSTAATFLAASTAAAAAGGCSLPRRASAADADDTGFTLGVQSYTFRKFDLEQALKRIKELGLKYAEFYSQAHPARQQPGASSRRSSTLCKEYDVTPVAFGVSRLHARTTTRTRSSSTSARRSASSTSAPTRRRTASTASTSCARSTRSPSPSTRTGRSGKDKRHRWWSAEVIMKAVKDHHKLIGTCLDTGHLIRMAQLGEKLDPAQQVKVMGNRNFGMHLKDHDNKRKTDVVFGKTACSTCRPCSRRSRR